LKSGTPGIGGAVLNPLWLARNLHGNYESRGHSSLRTTRGSMAFAQLIDHGPLDRGRPLTLPWAPVHVLPIDGYPSGHTWHLFDLSPTPPPQPLRHSDLAPGDDLEA